MRWEYLFDHTALQQGLSLYRRNMVYDLSCEPSGHLYRARVLSTFYSTTVSAVLKGGVPGSWYCDHCHRGRIPGKAPACAHLAALMFAIEADVAKHPERLNTRQYLKLKIGSAGGTYFDIDKIAGSVSVASDQVEHAEQLYRSGIMELTNFHLVYDRFDPAGCQTAEAQFFRTDDEDMGLFMDISPDQLLYCACDTPGCASVNEFNRGICVHGHAALLALRDYIAEHDPGDSTDQSASAMLDRLRKLAVRTNSENPAEDDDRFGRSVALSPRLEINSSSLNLSFRIWIDKPFVVKSLPDLIDHVDRRSAMALGKSQNLDFSSDYFDARSERLFDFIRTALGEQSARNDQAKRGNAQYAPQGKNITQQIDLAGSQLDDFFDMYTSETVEYTNKEEGASGQIGFSESLPELRLQLSTIRTAPDKPASGFRLSGTLPIVYRGAKFCYIPKDNTLYRVSAAQADIIRSVTGNINNRTVDLTIGKKNFPEFYHSLLPLLREVFTINDPAQSDLESFIDKQLRLTFYLDREESLLTCRAEAAYGDAVGSLKPAYSRFRENINAYVDRSSEARAGHVLRRYFPSYDDEKEIYSCPDTEENMFELITRGVSALSELGTVNATDAITRARVRKPPKVTMGVSVESDLLNLSVSSNDISREELLQLIDSYRAKKRWHRLNNGDFIELDNSIGELADLSDAMDLKPEDFTAGMVRVPAYRSLYLDKLLEKCEDMYTRRDSRFRQLARSFKTINDSDYEVPDALVNTLRPYQVYGYKWMRTVADNGFGGILADDMGLGKTLQTITVLLAEKQAGTEGTSLVICPASLVYNWKEEFARFAPEMRVGLLNGQKQDREAILADRGRYDVLITSYGLLTRDIKLFEGISFLYQIIDEAQFVKTHTTAASKAVRAINAKHRFALTGTPIENRLSELWSIFDYLMPGYLYNYSKFKSSFETPIVRKKDAEQSERLRKMVAPFILRRLKTDVLKDLPEKLEEKRLAVFEEEQQRLYDAQALRIRQLLQGSTNEDFNKKKLIILSELTRIRRICCDPSLVFEDYAGGSAKRDAALDLVQSAIEGGHRILLFSQFTSMLDLLEADLEKAGIEYLRLDGSTDKKDRVEMMHAFNDGDMPIFLISLKAGGTGLNLTGADVVIHYDPWWNPAVENQASDRAHRIGQTRAVTVYRLIAKDTIEERILRLQENKKELADAILSGENGSLAQLSREDLLSLLDAR